ncbi:glycosyltransferase family 4 protein [Gillisia marina]|uniref:glycosyltransferase family 4 protein n=1 Tax=Gillisia marina TaxID=1167637 RepID=UPI00029A687B|nr:glycosyltransferase family 4 protein [Gillisia marina]
MKKVLIITYYWPPAGGPGVQRWLKFVKYLRDFDIEPIVYVPENPDYPIVDNSLLKEIPKGVTILKKPIFEPYFLAKLFSKKETSTISSGIIKEEKTQNFLQKLFLYIRGNFFIPDARKFWIKPSVKFLSTYLSENKIDAIITTGPPHSLHLIGLGLKKKLELKWFADFRDPWTEIGYHKKLKLSVSAEAKHVALETEVLSTADHIITTSFSTQDEFNVKTNKPVSVITNGYDISAENSTELDKKFTLAHIGSLLSVRNPENLWKVLQELTSENNDFKEDFVLKLVGKVSDDVLSSIKSYGLEPNLELPGYVSHQKANFFQQTSQVLLLIEIDSLETKGIIPGKLFEYLAARRPILALGPKDWDVENILGETNAGTYFGYKDEESLKAHILSMYKLYKTQQLKVSSINTEKYSRKNLTGELAKLLKE